MENITEKMDIILKHELREIIYLDHGVAATKILFETYKFFSSIIEIEQPKIKIITIN